MSLFKRHIGRRVVGVGVGVALLMLGLAAPAFAAGPPVASFTPTSGPVGCVVDVTGGPGFKTSPAAQTHVQFVDPAAVATEATVVTFISDTELWATVPSGAAMISGTEYKIRVDNLLGTGTASTSTFLLTSGGGACAPTITSFTPTCGVTGDVLKITGTNLLASDQGGGLVEFSPFVAGTPPDGIDASPTNPDISDFTTLQVTVPGTAAAPIADGPIQVTTYTGGSGSGTLFSTTLFQTPPPDCPSAVPFARSITLSLRKHLVARGKVSASAATAPAGCTAAVPVKIQRRVSGHWKTVGSTTTSDTGAYKKRIRDRAGKYRAKAPKVTLASGEICSGATSPVRRVT